MISASAPGSAASTASRIAAVVGASTSSASAGSGTEVMPWMSVTRAPRASAASAIATPMRPVERLPMKRTGSMGSAVPPAVTTICQSARSWVAGWRGRASRWIGRPDRGVTDGRYHRRDELGRLREAALAHGPGRKWTHLRLHDGIAEATQPLDVGARRGVRVHASVHGRRHHDGSLGREAHRGDDVTRHAVRHGTQPVRRRRRHEHRVGGVRGDDVPDAPVRLELEGVEHHRSSAERLEREWPQEPRRAVGHEHLDVRARGLQLAHELSGLVCRDGPADPQHDEATVERPRVAVHAPVPTRRSARTSSASAASPCSSRSGSTRSAQSGDPSDVPRRRPVRTTLGRRSPPSSSAIRPDETRRSPRDGRG